MANSNNKFWSRLTTRGKNKLTHPSQKQFQQLINDPNQYVIHCQNYKMAVNLLCQFSHDDPTWDTTYQLIEKAINDHQQLIFSQFVISWTKQQNQFIPKIVYQQKELSSNLLVVNIFNHPDPKVSRCFTALDQLLQKQLKNQNLCFLLTNQIMIIYQSNQQYGLLFQ